MSETYYKAALRHGWEAEVYHGVKGGSLDTGSYLAGDIKNLWHFYFLMINEPEHCHFSFVQAHEVGLLRKEEFLVMANAELDKRDRPGETPRFVNVKEGLPLRIREGYTTTGGTSGQRWSIINSVAEPITMPLTEGALNQFLADMERRTRGRVTNSQILNWRENMRMTEDRERAMTVAMAGMTMREKIDYLCNLSRAGLLSGGDYNRLAGNVYAEEQRRLQEEFMRQRERNIAFGYASRNRIEPQMGWLGRITTITPNTFTLEALEDVPPHGIPDTREMDLAAQATARPDLTDSMTPIQKMKEVVRAKAIAAAAKGKKMLKNSMRTARIITVGICLFFWTIYSGFLLVDAFTQSVAYGVFLLVLFFIAFKVGWWMAS